MPDLGDIDGAEIIEVNVAVGDELEEEQVIVVVESDKASLEIPSPKAGKVESVSVSVGDKVGTGDALITLAVAGSSDSASAADDKEEPDREKEADAENANKAQGTVGKSDTGAQGKPAQKSEPPSSSREQAADSGASPSTLVHAGPAVRKLARETGVDLSQVSATGPKDRILKDDVHAYVKQRLEGSPPAGGAGGGLAVDLPDIDFSQFGDIDRVELNKLRKVSAQNLTRSWLTIPHVTQHDNADITDLEAFRKNQNKRLEREGVKLTMLAFLVAACARALKEYPVSTARWKTVAKR